MAQKRLFVTGTDTDIGKTVLSLLLMQYYFQKGMSPFYIKPFQTGCSEPEAPASDAAFIKGHIPEAEKREATSVIHCFREPKAPFFAARDENRAIDTDQTLEDLKTIGPGRNPVIIEGAGGLMVPVTDSILMIDLLPKMNARPILAARAGLGTINHTLLSLEMLRHRGIPEPVVFLIEQPGLQTPVQMQTENMEAIKRFSGISPAGIIPPIPDLSNPPSEIFTLFENGGL